MTGFAGPVGLVLLGIALAILGFILTLAGYGAWVLVLSGTGTLLALIAVVWSLRMDRF